MAITDSSDLLRFDRQHVWHPYTSMTDPTGVHCAVGAKGVHIELADGRRLLDGMASWWSAIHGYNHPVLNEVARVQLDNMAHVMFGGLTHAPAVELAKRLLDLAPDDIDCVFLCDSGSVAVEVAMKMALQYWSANGVSGRQRFLTVRNGYHGDTLHAMSVCDPTTGMHRLFGGALPQQLFADAPPLGYDRPLDETDLNSFASLLHDNVDAIAGVILEPIVQGAGGMRFYSPQYLRRVRELTAASGTLLILDEIATGLGRTGRMFAAEHAGICPDIMCVGKALTGGYMTLGAAMTTRDVAQRVSGNGHVLMHGPTFMGNPLACAVANASIDLLLASPWQQNVQRIEHALSKGLAPCRDLPHVVDVRTLGAIGVIELDQQVDVAAYQQAFVARGVWVRPFGNLVYVMPPYVMQSPDLQVLSDVIVEVVTEHPL